MGRRKDCRDVLQSEVRRWSALSCPQLASELHEARTYEVVFDSAPYQLEVVLLENTETYVHVMVAVDDGTLSTAIAPLSDSFINRKP